MCLILEVSLFYRFVNCLSRTCHALTCALTASQWVTVTTFARLTYPDNIEKDIYTVSHLYCLRLLVVRQADGYD